MDQQPQPSAPPDAAAYGLPQGEFDSLRPLAEAALTDLPELRQAFAQAPDRELLRNLARTSEHVAPDRQQLNSLKAEVADLAARTGRELPKMPAKTPPTPDELKRIQTGLAHTYFSESNLQRKLQEVPKFTDMMAQEDQRVHEFRQESLWWQEQRDLLRQVQQQPMVEDAKVDEGQNPVMLTKIDVELEHTRAELNELERTNRHLGLQQALRRYIEALEKTRAGDYMLGVTPRKAS